jgi:histidinol-phosphate aminotransferase
MVAMIDVARPRPPVATLPAYRAGRTPEMVAAEHGLARAVKLASNEAPFGPLPSVRAVIDEQAALAHRYPEVQADSLRAAIGTRLDVGIEHVTVGAGSSGLLWQIAQAFLDPGDELLIPWPSFEAYPIVGQLMGASVVRAPLDGFTVDVDAMIDAVTDRTKVAVVADPNNPTGTALDGASLQRLAEATAERCLLVIDEAYLEFRTRSDAVDVLALARRYEHVLVLRTFSKAYGLAGLRVGYALGPRSFVEYVDRVAVPFAVSSVAQAAATASLSADAELQVFIDGVVAERSRVERALRERGWSVPDPQANFVLLPAGAFAVELADALERRGCITRPFAGLGVRVTIGTPEEDDEMLAAFDDVASELTLADAWTLPTGDDARAVGRLLDRLVDGEVRAAVAGAASLAAAASAAGTRHDRG